MCFPVQAITSLTKTEIWKSNKKYQFCDAKTIVKREKSLKRNKKFRNKKIFQSRQKSLFLNIFHLYMWELLHTKMGNS